MPNEIAELKQILFEIFAAGYEAGYAQEKDIKIAYEEWFQKALLEHLPPNSPYVS